MSEAVRIRAPGGGDLSGLLDRAGSPGSLLVFAHGAGAGMEHSFMTDVARRLAGRDVSVLRFRFPYMEAGRKRPDSPDVATAAVQAALAEGVRIAGGIPVFAGGKSFGGRMTSMAASQGMLDAAAGLVFFGFPLHALGRPSPSRADHLAGVRHPQLYLQGTRDGLADLDLLRGVLSDLGDRATLHVVEGADHGFHVLKRSGRTDAEVLDEMIDIVTEWITRTTERQ